MVPFQQLKLSAMVERLLKLAVCTLNLFLVYTDFDNAYFAFCLTALVFQVTEFQATFPDV